MRRNGTAAPPLSSLPGDLLKLLHLRLRQSSFLGHRVIFTPTTVLNPTAGTSVQVRFTTSLQDVGGLALAHPEATRFCVQDPAVAETEVNDDNDGDVDAGDLPLANVLALGLAPSSARVTGAMASATDADVFSFTGAVVGERLMATVIGSRGVSGNTLLVMVDGTGADPTLAQALIARLPTAAAPEALELGRTLRYASDPALVPLLADLARTGQAPHQRQGALLALEGRPAEAWLEPAVEAFDQDPHPDVRETAANLLARSLAGRTPGPRRSAWVRVLKRVFEVGAWLCPRCQTEMLVVAWITDPAVIDRLLA